MDGAQHRQAGLERRTCFGRLAHLQQRQPELLVSDGQKKAILELVKARCRPGGQGSGSARLATLGGMDRVTYEREGSPPPVARGLDELLGL